MKNKKYYYVKEYLSVYRYVMNSIVIGLSCFMPFMAFIIAGAFANQYYFIGAGIVLLFVLYLVVLIIYKIFRNDRQSDFGIVQQYDFLYLFPNTKKQVIIPLGNIKQIHKKNNFRYQDDLKSSSGRLTIVTEQSTHSIQVRNVNVIYRRLNENLKLYREYENMTESQIKEYVLKKEYVEVRAPLKNSLVLTLVTIILILNLIVAIASVALLQFCDKFSVIDFFIALAVLSVFSLFGIVYMFTGLTAIEQKDETLIIRPNRKERVVVSLADIEYINLVTMSGLPKKRLVIITKSQKYILTILNFNVTYNNLRCNLFAFAENSKMKQQGVNEKEPM